MILSDDEEEAETADGNTSLTEGCLRLDVSGEASSHSNDEDDTEKPKPVDTSLDEDHKAGNTSLIKDTNHDLFDAESSDEETGGIKRSIA